MIYFTIVFFCVAGLFLTLLQDRFRIWATLLVTAGVYLLSLGTAFALRRLIHDPILAGQIPCAAGALLFFLSSLFLHSNHVLQKFFVAFLSLCNYAFLDFFIPLLLGALPFSTAGALAGVLSIAVTLLFNLLMGLCLYRPFHHYSDRGVSGFLIGMFLLLCVLYPLCLGKFDFLFRTNIFAARLLAAVVLYGAMVFGFRSVYQAGRFRASTAAQEARERMLEMEANDLFCMQDAVREVEKAQKNGEYTLDTIHVMLRDGAEDQAPAYIASVKKNGTHNPVLAQYYENPYVNAVIAMKAAFAAQNNIEFQCNMTASEIPLQTAELCIIVNEMLSQACLACSASPEPRKLRFTAIPGETSIRFEAVYSGTPPVKEAFSVKGKKWSQILQWLFDENPEQEEELTGLENTQEIISRYSGRLSISGTPGEIILQADIHF